MADAIWFTLFRNRYHQRGDKKPCLSNRHVEINGQAYEAAVWKKDDDKYSVKLTPVEAEQAAQEQPTNQRQHRQQPPPRQQPRQEAPRRPREEPKNPFA